MPPKQDDSIFLNTSGHSGIENVNSPPLKTALSTSSDDSLDLSAHYQASAERATRLASKLLEQENKQAASSDSSCSSIGSFSSDEGGMSLTTAACKSSLQNKLPAVLHQTAVLVERCCDTNSNNNNNNNTTGENDNNSDLVALTRSRLGLHRVDQYLDKIELTLEKNNSDKNAALEEGLGEILASLKAQSSAQVDEDVFDCSVSPLHGASELYFDVAVGPKVSWQGAAPQLPLRATVQPLIELYSRDITERAIVPESIHPYSVTFESCKHSAEKFHANSGWTGQACIRLRLKSAAAATEASSKRKTFSEWSYEAMEAAEEEAIVISEARVSQPNAFPPRPRCNVDVYTSYTVGGDSSGLEVILVAKTFRTQNGEMPQLEVELLMPVTKKSNTNSASAF